MIVTSNLRLSHIDQLVNILGMLKPFNFGINPLVVAKG